MNTVKMLGAAALVACGIGFAGSASAAPLPGFQPALTDGGAIENVTFGYGYGYGYYRPRPVYYFYRPRPVYYYRPYIYRGYGYH